MEKIRIILTGGPQAGKDTSGAYLIEQHGFTRLSFVDPMKAEAAASYRRSPESVTPDFLNDQTIKQIPQDRLPLAYCDDKNFVSVALEAYAAEDALLLNSVLNDSTKINTAWFNSKDAHGISPIDRIKETRSFRLQDRLMLPRSSRRITQAWGTEYRRLSVHGHPLYWVNQLADTLDRHPATRIVITDGRTDEELDLGEAQGFHRIHLINPRAPQADSHKAEQIRPPKDCDTVIINDSDFDSLFSKLDAYVNTLARPESKSRGRCCP